MATCQDLVWTNKGDSTSKTWTKQHRSKPVFLLRGVPRLKHPSQPYKWAQKIQGDRILLPSSELSDSVNMDSEWEQSRIESILETVNSLDDLTAEVVAELRYATKQSLTIEKFKVSLEQYHDWVDKVGDDNRGVEFDGRTKCLVLKAYPGRMHEIATDVIRNFLWEVKDRLETATGLIYESTGSADCSLDESFGCSVKQPDGSLRTEETECPVIILEVGISETTHKLYEDARRWLEGSNGDTKLVILIDVQEQGCRKASRDKWGLDTTQFRQMQRRQLFNHILQWYHSNNISLLGNFHLSVHLWYSDSDKQCVLNNAAFSLGNLISLGAIHDVPLRLDSLMPVGSTDDNEPLFFPLRKLVATLQRGFRFIEKERASKLAHDTKERYPCR